MEQTETPKKPELRPVNEIERELVAASAFAGELSYSIASYNQELTKTYSKMSELKAEIDYTVKHAEIK